MDAVAKRAGVGNAPTASARMAFLRFSIAYGLLFVCVTGP